MALDAFIELSPSFDSDFQKYVIKELSKKLKRRAGVIKQRIQEPLQNIVRESIIAPPKYSSRIYSCYSGISLFARREASG